MECHNGGSMKKRKIVIALGHKVLGRNLPEQAENLGKAVKPIADIIESGASVAITHSNGSQVGMVHTAMNEFAVNHTNYTGAPMAICSAMSQGYIGYDIQNKLRSELIRRGIYKPVVTLITQVTVDPYDPALYRPAKEIGRILSEKEAREQEEKGNYVTQVEGGYRRMIAAPEPVDIIEMESIQLLFDAGQIVIAGGGGGIPVMEQGYDLKGAGAVIEKDLISGKMAELLHADDLIMLTSVKNVCLNYGTPDEKPIGEIKVSEIEKYADEGHFEKGTMLPKIEAAVNFIKKGGKRVVITSIANAKDGYRGRSGTVIVPDDEAGL